MVFLLKAQKREDHSLNSFVSFLGSGLIADTFVGTICIVSTLYDVLFSSIKDFVGGKLD